MQPLLHSAIQVMARDAPIGPGWGWGVLVSPNVLLAELLFSSDGLATFPGN